MRDMLKKVAFAAVAAAAAFGHPLRAAAPKNAERSYEAAAETIQAIERAAPDAPLVKPGQSRKLLVYGRMPTHPESVVCCFKAMEILGRKTGAFEAVASGDPIVFLPENLRQFDAVVMNNTHERSPMLPWDFDRLGADEQAAAKEREPLLKKSLVEFVAAGKGLVGIHGATAVPGSVDKIALLCIGMSNTHGAFARFQEIAGRDADMSPQVVLVDGSSGGQHALSWADPEGRHARAPRVAAGPDPSAARESAEADNWSCAEHQLREAGVTAAEVQVVWMKQAIMNPVSYGLFPAHARLLEESMALILQNARRRYANLRLAFVSSRTYGGYAVRELNPEPFAYEIAFAVRWLIRKQIAGDPELNWDPQRGPVRAPVLLWGPYFWADGLTPRKSDGLTWAREDYAPPPDGTHPSEQGYDTVARRLLEFFKSDPLARPWFLKTSVEETR